MPRPRRLRTNVEDAVFDRQEPDVAVDEEVAQAASEDEFRQALHTQDPDAETSPSLTAEDRGVVARLGSATWAQKVRYLKLMLGEPTRGTVREGHAPLSTSGVLASMEADLEDDPNLGTPEILSLMARASRLIARVTAVPAEIEHEYQMAWAEGLE